MLYTLKYIHGYYNKTVENKYHNPHVQCMILVPRINHIYHQQTAVCWQQQFLAEPSTVAVTLVVQSGNTFPT